MEKHGAYWNCQSRISRIKERSSERKGITCSVNANPEQGVIDWARALGFFDGDRDLMKEVVKIALEETPRLLQNVRDAIKSDDTESLRKAAHTLGGSIRNFGETQASTLALKLEQMGENGNLEDGRQVLTAMEHAMAGFLCDLSKYAKKPVRGQP